MLLTGASAVRHDRHNLYTVVQATRAPCCSTAVNSMTEVAGPGEATELSEAADETKVATAEAAEENEAAPTTIDVICGTKRAKFLVDSWRVVIDGALATARRAAGLHCEGRGAQWPWQACMLRFVLSSRVLNQRHCKLVHLAICGVQPLRKLSSLSIGPSVCPEENSHQAMSLSHNRQR